MSVQSLTPTINFVSADKNTFSVYGNLALATTDNYVAGGIPLSFAGLDRIKTRALPLQVQVYSAQPNATKEAQTYIYQFSAGTTLANGFVQIFVQAAADTGFAELSAGAIPDGVYDDVIGFTAIFVKNTSTLSQS